uniref:Uncharacterized protein n=1 Tax=Anolis carolinensis TaxID=28377 RepID=H9GQ68_ANOCA
YIMCLRAIPYLFSTMESSIMDTNDLCKQSPLPNPDKILAYPHFFFKVKKSRFGPPRSRRRIFIAPPMGRKAPFKPTLQPHMPFDLTRKAQTLEFPLENDISSEEDEIQKLDAWIEKRKQLWDLLNCCVNLEEWLNAKQPGTELEASVLGRIKEDKEPKEVKMEPALEAVKSIEVSVTERQCGYVAGKEPPALKTVLAQKGSYTRGPCVSKVSSCAQSKSKFLLRQMDYLEVPPINTEPDRMHLTYSQMEVVGKRYKEMRRMLKRKIDPLDFAEQCRMVKTGDRAVDGHCLPSTMEGEVGELVDKHRLACHLVWTQCVKRCRKLRIPISEKALKKGLLYPGDRILREENQFRKMRQPGGYYSAYFLPESSSSDEESRTLMLTFSLFYSMSFLTKPFCCCFNRELMKMFNFLNPLTDPNSFWPGHLLDKLYFPEMEHDGGHPLFHRVSRKLPVYPSIYSPDRNWPVNDQGYVTYGDPDSRKHNYYI